MSAFEQYADTPYKLVNEGREIILRFERTSPTTGKVTWTIPPNGAGCDADSPPAYNGILITLDDTPSSIEKTPTDGERYVADPTGDRNLHMGDKLGTALVVGAVYDREVTTLDITNLEPNTVYFVSGHAMDSVLRYYTAGVHSYSTKYGDQKEASKPAVQVIEVGQPSIGVTDTDLTGLDSNTTYELKAVLDNDEKVTFSIDGSLAQTYREFIDELNKQAKLYGSPLQSPMMPNVGMYFYKVNEPTVQQWNGTSYDEFGVIVQNGEPQDRNVGDVWLDTSSNTLYEWNGTVWSLITAQTTLTDPTIIDNNDYWLSLDTEAHKWNGTVWIPLTTIESSIDPAVAPTPTPNTHWFNESDNVLYKLNAGCDKWNSTIALVWDSDPANLAIDTKWFDETNSSLLNWNGSSFDELVVTISSTEPNTVMLDDYWYNSDTMELYQYNGSTFVEVDVLVWHLDPTTPRAGELWWNSTTDQLSQWSSINSQWKSIDVFLIQSNDPLIDPMLESDTIWVSHDSVKSWDGSEWNVIYPIRIATDPNTFDFNNTVWLDGNNYKRYNGTSWVSITPLIDDADPFVPSSGDFWYNSDSNQLSKYDGVVWNSVMFSTSTLKPSIGYKYFDTNLNELREWNGYGWINSEPKFSADFYKDGRYVKLTTSAVGSYAKINIDFEKDIQDIFLAFDPPAQPKGAVAGSDGLSEVPSYAQLGVGTDGSDDERRELIDSIRHQLGYPTVDVELTKQQFNYAIDSAIESLRKRSGSAYKRGFYFLDMQRRRQHYQLTDKKNGMDKIVQVTQMHRLSSSFMSHAEGQGVYGQMALQHLYQMGTFDLISYQLVSQYIETMEQLFASHLTFNWNEDTRTLMVFKDFYKPERVLMEVVVERTEQQMIKDRYLKSWIEKYAMVQCKYMLSHIRSKYSNLPGAGGGVSLNGAELAAQADNELLDLYEQLDDYVANNPEEYGAGSTMLLG